MKKILFATVILLTSCGAFDRDYKFYFYNHSSRDISIIIDLNAKDEIMEVGLRQSVHRRIDLLMLINRGIKW